MTHSNFAPAIAPAHRPTLSAALVTIACLVLCPTAALSTPAQTIEFGDPIPAPSDSVAQIEARVPATEAGSIAPPEPLLLPTIAETAPAAIDPVPSPSAEAFPIPTAIEVEPTAEAIAQTEPTEPAATERFGTTGQRYWYVQGGSAISFDRDDDGFAGMGLAGVGLTEFVGSGHSINAELNALGFLQPGTDALGINLTVLSRWHFVRQENWSLYVDGGAGVMATTSEVPADGSPINFTPQAGIGTTIRLRDEDQLMIGLRWHHISNANLFESNPGRDSILLYLGLSRRR